MGLTYVVGVAVGPQGAEAQVDFLVDSGAQYTQLPYDTWNAIGLVAMREQRFRLANGDVVRRQIANCLVRLGKLGETPTPVVLGEPGDVALLGAVTLEELGLMLDPFNRTLHPAAMLLI